MVFGCLSPYALVLFPDIPECLAQGNDLTQAYETAVEALGLAAAIYDRQRRPPSAIWNNAG